MSDETATVIRLQPTLDDAMFPAIDRNRVPMVRLQISGTVEMTRSAFEGFCRDGLEPGRIVNLAMTGYLPNPHVRWVRRSAVDGETRQRETWWELEGAVKVKALELGAFELTDEVYSDGE